jgi:hypothetical protein
LKAILVTPHGSVLIIDVGAGLVPRWSPSKSYKLTLMEV